MKTITLTREQNFNPREYIRRTALESDYSNLINYSCMMIDHDTGELIGVYFIMPKTPTKLLKALLSIKYDKNKRLACLLILEYLATNPVKKLGMIFALPLHLLRKVQ